MNEQDFLDYGTSINRADDPLQMELLMKRLRALPQDDESTLLLNAAQRKVQRRMTTCSHQVKEALMPLSKLWNSLDERARGNLKDVLAGTMEIDRITHQAKNSVKFYDWLKVFAGTDNPIPVIKAFLLIQEATEQFLEAADGKQKAPGKWTTLQSVRTIWPSLEQQATPQPATPQLVAQQQVAQP